MIFVVGGLGAGKRAFLEQQFGYLPEQMSNRPENETPVLYGLEDLAPLPPLEDLLRREAVGRLCCALAEQAQAVYRVNCGIPMQLK